MWCIPADYTLLPAMLGHLRAIQFCATAPLPLACNFTDPHEAPVGLINPHFAAAPLTNPRQPSTSSHRLSSTLQVTAACRQYRCRDCRECTSHIYTQGPAIESSSGMRFAPWNANYPGLKEQLAASGLVTDELVETSAGNNFDRCVRDEE